MVGIAGNGCGYLQRVFEVVHAHGQRLSHLFGTATGDRYDFDQVADKRPRERIRARSANQIEKIRDGMPGYDGSSRCLLTPVYDSAAVGAEVRSARCDVYENVGIDQNLQRL